MGKHIKWWRTLDRNIVVVSAELTKTKAAMKEMRYIIHSTKKISRFQEDEMVRMAGEVAVLQTELDWLHEKKGDDAGKRVIAQKAHDDMQRIVGEIVGAAHENQGKNHGKKEGGK